MSREGADTSDWRGPEVAALLASRARPKPGPAIKAVRRGLFVSDGYNRGRGRGTKGGFGALYVSKAARGRHARSGGAFPYAVSGASAPAGHYR